MMSNPAPEGTGVVEVSEHPAALELAPGSVIIDGQRYPSGPVMTAAEAEALGLMRVRT